VTGDPNTRIDRAIAVADALRLEGAERQRFKELWPAAIDAYLAETRLVPLAAVLDALRDKGERGSHTERAVFWTAADFLEREFGPADNKDAA